MNINDQINVNRKFENLTNFGQVKIEIDKLLAKRETQNKNGKKRKCFDDLKVQNKRKLLRNSGQEYENVSNRYQPFARNTFARMTITRTPFARITFARMKLLPERRLPE